MKFTLLLALQLTFGCVMGQSFTAVPDNNGTLRFNELILGIPKISDKTIDLLIESIDQTNGVKYIYYCPLHNLVLLTYDKKIYGTDKRVVEALMLQEFNMPMFIKEGTFKEVMEMCE